jgi:SAM-dependent methyltransferase
MIQCDKDCSVENPLEQVRLLYTELAQNPGKDFGWGKGKKNAGMLGYADEWLRRLPDIVWESAAAVGNPFSLGHIHPGETVIDIGCGAGADACIAAMLVGKGGKVFGIDCTPAMIAKASRSASVSGLPQAVFQEAEMTELPLPDCTADAVISNGAINLAMDKDAVLAEVYRVLRSGGRLQIADMVRDTSAEDSAGCSSDESWADCVSGTLEPGTFLLMLSRAGFVDVELAGFTGYRTSSSTIGALFKAIKPD